jgi:predicted TPR repeat methyltransferase
MLLMLQDADVDSLLQRLANAGEPDVPDKVPASHAAALFRQYATVQPHLAA